MQHLQSIYKYNPSGSPSVFVFITLSLADLKSAIWTLILRSRRASRPASEQMALISAPDRSSFWLMNSSSSTSSPKDILEVWRVKILRLVFSSMMLAHEMKGRVKGHTIRVLEEDLSVDSARADQGRVKRVDLICSQNDLDVPSIIKAV